MCLVFNIQTALEQNSIVKLWNFIQFCEQSFLPLLIKFHLAKLTNNQRSCLLARQPGLTRPRLLLVSLRPRSNRDRRGGQVMRKKGWLAGYREIGRGGLLILMSRLTRGVSYWWEGWLDNQGRPRLLGAHLAVSCILLKKHGQRKLRLWIRKYLDTH